MRNLAGVDRIDDWRDRKELVPGTRHQHNDIYAEAKFSNNCWTTANRHL